MSKHTVIYSHGFGVRKDDRGLFTDIAAALPNAQHIMFGYNQVDEATNNLTVAPPDQQAQKLRQLISEAKANNPDATIDLIFTDKKGWRFYAPNFTSKSRQMRTLALKRPVIEIKCSQNTHYSIDTPMDNA